MTPSCQCIWNTSFQL